MANFKLRKVTWDDIDLDEDDVMTFPEATRELQVSVNAVIKNV